MARERAKVERGDFQTPLELARRVVGRLAALGLSPRAVLEPTCGRGAFLQAGREAFPRAALIGVELDAGHAQAARDAVPEATIHSADFFDTDWPALVARLPSPLLVLGNPPWVTTAGLGAIGGANAPPRSNEARLAGLDARTGRANFDISEWMIARLLDALSGRDATMAVLVKASVARKLIERCGRAGLRLPGALHRVDARAHFAASVEAVLLRVAATAEAAPDEAPLSWPLYASLDASEPATSLAYVGGMVTPDLVGHRATAHLTAAGKGEWRSGIKHDCAEVFELELRDGRPTRRDGAPIDVEAEVVYPLLKGGDLERGALSPRRALLVPHRDLRDGSSLATCPRAARYFAAHEARLRQRKSSIYEGRPASAIFGVGTYSFAPFKVAVSGLAKQLRFHLVGPCDGRPVMLDDTCYFLPFWDDRAATRALAALESDAATAFFEARRFVDDKRPVNKRLLDSLDLARLTSAADGSSR